MGRKKTHTPAESGAKRTQVEALAAQGKAVAEAVRSIGVTEQTFHRWRGGVRGVEPDQGERVGAGHAAVRGAVRSVGGTEQTFHRWGAEFGGLKLDQVKRLEAENARLRKAVSDLTLEKAILKEAASGNFFSIRGARRNFF